MPDPSDLIETARVLSGTRVRELPSEAMLRRAVSSAYYALFHKIAGAAADRFVGASHRTTAAYAVLYRGIEHRAIRAVFNALDVTTLSDKYRSLLRRTSVSQELRRVAEIFLTLQESRHLADYHPSFDLSPADVASLIESAILALTTFDRVAADERDDVLALLVVGSRS